MEFYKILINHAKNLNLTNRIGSGADGIVWLTNNKVVKICIGDYLKFVQILKSLDNNYVKVYEHKKIDKYLDADMYLYYMEKLNKLTEDENKVFYTLVSHEDSSKIKSFSDKKAIKILDELERFLEFDKNKVFKFIKQISANNIKHLDICERNIMKDDCGNFKLIDLERVKT